MSRRHTKGGLRLVAALLLVLVMLFCGLRLLETTVLRNGREEVSKPVSKTIERDGVKYFPRQDITVFLVMGIDQYGKVEASKSYNNHGAADMVALVIFDEAKETYTILHINRDTMVEMPVLGIGGKQAGTYFGQLALSHTYGTGLEDSCENTRQTVADFLGGIHIDYYVAMNMDAIRILNDGVGGVTVENTEDFSAVDATIPMGTVKLKGEQAITYVRTRKDIGDQLNLSRIDRQEKYIDGFLAAFRQTQQQDAHLLTRLYEDVAGYLVTDCSINSLTAMLERYEDYALTQVVTPAGDNVMGEKYFEFYADETALDALILRLFYAPK